MKTFSIKTFGCKVNQYDSQVIREKYLKDGYIESDAPDVYIVNTCCVTDRAEKKSRQFIRHIKREFPNSKVIVNGCCVDGRPEGYGISSFQGHTRAFVKIQDGCNQFCSYCVLPYIRGRSRCRDLEEVLAEVERLASNGYREIVLTGVHLGDYNELPRLLREIQGVLRIRLSSIEPQDLTTELIEEILRNEKVCRHLHIPLQSGSDKILERMNRDYTYRSYKELVEKIPGFSFTTDIIVGFPGEDEEGFLKTTKAVEEIGFIKVHIFPYSNRPGTIATDMSDRIPQEEIRQRTAVLKKIAEKRAQIEKLRLLGSIQDVLVEDNGEGYTSGYFPVRVKGNAVINETAKVGITDLDGQYLTGVVI